MLAYLLAAWLNRVIVKEFEFEIKPGERLPVETLIPMPEMSYTQEMLTKAIPIHHRIAHLPVSIDQIYRELNIDDIAKELKVSSNWANTKAKEIDLKPMNLNGKYPDYAKDVLEEELWWDKLYDKLGDRVSLEGIVEILGRERPWVLSWAADIGSFPTLQIMDSERQVLSYETGVLYQLRHVILSVLPANGWLTAGQIAQDINLKRERVVALLKKYEIDGEWRWHSDGREVMHYPPEVVDIIKSERRSYPPAGDWLPIKTMALRLGKDWDWVAARVKDFEATKKLDSNGKPNNYYNPSVFESLKEEANRLEHAQTFLGVRGLALALGKSTSWVSRRLPYIQVKSEEQLDRGNRSYVHYHPDAVEALLSLPNDILKRQPKTKG